MYLYGPRPATPPQMVPQYSPSTETNMSLPQRNGLFIHGLVGNHDSEENYPM